MNDYTALGFQVRFSAMLPNDKIVATQNEIYFPESLAYKVMFLHEVSDITVKMAIDHAVQKLNRFIDSLS